MWIVQTNQKIVNENDTDLGKKKIKPKKLNF